MQKSGDKSSELSVKTWRTQDLLSGAEDSGGEDSAGDETSTSQAHADEDDQNVDNNDGDDGDDDDLSVDDNEDGAEFNNTSALNNGGDDDDDDDLMFFEEDGDDDDENDDGNIAAPISDDEGNESNDENEDIGINSSSYDDSNRADDRPQDYRSGNDAHSTLTDLLEVYSSRNQVSFEQYERSLQQLHTKWENVLEQTMFDHQQFQINMDQERQDLELHIEELREAHKNELEASKAAVMEQSQKIILEEMKLNADREVRMVKSEETAEITIQNAIEETRREMNEDFEIALGGMQAAQDEMKERYEKLVEETEIRARDEVESGVKQQYESKMASFMETYEEMKAQVLDQTMQIQALKMDASKGVEMDALVASLENEVKVLQKSIEDTKVLHQGQLEQMQMCHDKEKVMLQNSSDNVADPQALAVAVEKAQEEIRKDMTEEFDIVLSGMKTAQAGLTARYEKLIKETEIRVRDEVFAEAKKDADRTVSAFKAQYEEVKKQVIDMAIEIEKLELDASSKASEIDVLNASVESNASAIEDLHDDLKMKKDEINKLESELETKTDRISQLEADCAELTRATNEMITAFEGKKKTLEDANNDKIKTLEADVASKNRNVEELRAELQCKDLEIRKLSDNLSAQNISVISKESEVANRLASIESDIKSKQDEIATKEHRLQELGAEIAALSEEKEQQKQTFDKKLSKKAALIDQLRSEVDTKDNGIKDLVKEMDAVALKIESFSSEINSKDKLIQTKDKTIKDLSAVIAAKDSLLRTKSIELTNVFEAKDKKIKELEGEIGTKDADFDQFKAEHDAKIKEIMDAHLIKVQTLETSIKDKDEALGQKELEHQAALSDAKEQLRLQLQSQHEKEMQSIQNDKEQSQVKFLQQKYNAEIHRLHNAVEAEKVAKNLKYEEMIQNNKEKSKLAESEFSKTLNALKDDHKKEIESRTKEVTGLQGILQGMKIEIQTLKDAHTETVAGLDRQHQEAILRLEEEHSHESAEALRLINQLRVEKDTLLTSTRSISSANASNSSSKRSAKRKNPLADGPKKTKKIIEGPPLNAQLLNIEHESRKAKENDLNQKLGNITEAPSEVSKMTPEKNISSKDEDIVSPLTMTSPLAKKKTLVSSISVRTPRKIPKTVDARRKRRTSSLASPETRSVKTVPARTPLSSRRKVPAETPKAAPSKSKTMKKKISSSSLEARSSVSVSSLAKSPGSRTRSSATVASRSSFTRRVPASSRRSRTELKSVKERSREGLFSSCESELPTVNTQPVHLLVINVPLTDRRKRIAKILGIELVNDVLKATHVIVGDDENHIRRTAKLMAALCVTPNILRSDWLEDCYKHRSIVNTAHHILLNDYVAEKAYCFSMKQTIKEGNERRKYGGLFRSWKILVCDGVAGNKAPKQSDLRMMVEAAGGSWLEPCKVPVPIEEDPSHVIVITSDPATSEQLNDEKNKTAAENGGGFFTTSWLFDSLMHQKIIGMKRGLGRL